MNESQKVTLILNEIWRYQIPTNYTEITTIKELINSQIIKNTQISEILPRLYTYPKLFEKNLRVDRQFKSHLQNFGLNITKQTKVKEIVDYLIAYKPKMIENPVIEFELNFKGFEKLNPNNLFIENEKSDKKNKENLKEIERLKKNMKFLKNEFKKERKASEKKIEKMKNGNEEKDKEIENLRKEINRIKMKKENKKLQDIEIEKYESMENDFDVERLDYVNDIKRLKEEILVKDVKIMELKKARDEIKFVFKGIKKNFEEKRKRFEKMQNTIKQLRKINQENNQDINIFEEKFKKDQSNLENFENVIKEQQNELKEKELIITNHLQSINKLKKNYVNNYRSIKELLMKNEMLNSKINNVDEEVDLVYYGVVDATEMKENLCNIGNNIQSALSSVSTLLNKFERM